MLSISFLYSLGKERLAISLHFPLSVYPFFNYYISISRFCFAAYLKYPVPSPFASSIQKSPSSVSSYFIRPYSSYIESNHFQSTVFYSFIITSSDHFLYISQPRHWFFPFSRLIIPFLAVGDWVWLFGFAFNRQKLEAVLAAFQKLGFRSSTSLFSAWAVYQLGSRKS